MMKINQDRRVEPVTDWSQGLIGNDHASRVWKGVPWRNNSKINSIASFITCACRLQMSVISDVHTASLMATNHPVKKRPAFLTLPEIKRVVTAFADCGTSKVRITGGEPSLRKDFPQIIETVANTPGITKVATTTNGYRMAKQVDTWQQAGLTHINVSVDSLDPRMFHQITGENKFTEVMAGIDRAFEIGYEQVKVNVVLMKDLNAKELPSFLNWIKDRPIQLRFIELMQTGEMDELFQNHHVSGVDIRNQLIANGWILKARQNNDGPAQVFVHADYKARLG